MRDQLAEQRRQLSEIERIRSLAGSGNRSTSSGTRSHAVMPPSGAERPANHLQVNKIAQVIVGHFTVFFSSQTEYDLGKFWHLSICCILVILQAHNFFLNVIMH